MSRGPWIGARTVVLCTIGVWQCGHSAAEAPTPPPRAGEVPSVAQGAGAAAKAGPGAGGGAAAQDAPPCSDLFDQDKLRDYWVDIRRDEWAKMTDEFMDVKSVLAGMPRESYHPIVFHLGSKDGETVTDAQMRLRGQSSRVLTVENDRRPKMQVVIAFDQTNPRGRFHGEGKLVFDMPRSDWTFLHERLANTWWRQRGVMAPCSASGRLFINGHYYGLYVVEEHVGHGLVKDFFPTNPDGNLFKGGVEPDHNKTPTNFTRLRAFWSAADVNAMKAIIDLDGSLLQWAGDALLNNGDGYYGGSHNFMIYDQGSKGFVYLPTDTDSTFDWLALNTNLTDAHPIYWWQGRISPDRPGQHYLAVVNDPTWRRRYVDAIATQLEHWDVPTLQSWIDTWSRQISQAVREDPHKQVTFNEWQGAIATARTMVAGRATYLQRFLACERGQDSDGAATDADGDGYRWCEDCRDTDPAVHPGAPEVCGNKIDDNCDGLVDVACSATSVRGGQARKTAH